MALAAYQFFPAFGLEANELFVTGESYGGHYVPAMAATIVVNNNAGVKPRLNIKGVAIGNGFVAPLEMSGGYADIIFNAGLLSPREYEVAKSYTHNITAAIEAGDYVGAYLVWDSFLNGDSTPGGAWFTNVTGLTNYFNVAIDTPPDFSYPAAYVNTPAVRAALGVGAAPFNDGNLAVELALKGDGGFSQKPRLEALLAAGVRALIYNGALDLICGAPLTLRYIDELAYPDAAAFRAAPKVIWHDVGAAGTVAGYARTAGALTNVVMRGAGHMAVRLAACAIPL
jgi:vitellogenic carboxypeptidase-like protein